MLKTGLWQLVTRLCQTADELCSPVNRSCFSRELLMALTEQDRDYIREVAINSATEVCKQVIEDMLKWHTEACPHGKSILASKWVLLGVCIGSGIGGGGVVAVLIKIFSEG